MSDEEEENRPPRRVIQHRQTGLNYDFWDRNFDKKTDVPCMPWKLISPDSETFCGTVWDIWVIIVSVMDVSRLCRLDSYIDSLKKNVQLIKSLTNFITECCIVE
jgi:hypothetical protein